MFHVFQKNLNIFLKIESFYDSNDFRKSISLVVTLGISSPIQFFFEPVSLSIYLFDENVRVILLTTASISFSFMPGSEMTNVSSVAFSK